VIRIDQDAHELAGRR
jgi:hypothetical protein